jgi:hypothetical protein
MPQNTIFIGCKIARTRERREMKHPICRACSVLARSRRVRGADDYLGDLIGSRSMSALDTGMRIVYSL